MKYIFGPVNSRRLGLSLGIDLLPAKTCNFNCIYCEVGPNMVFTCERKEYTPTKDIIAEIDSFLINENRLRPIDVFTITASGEPTLHCGLAEIISHIKKKSSKPVAVLTNGSTLFHKDVRNALKKSDIVIPSLDSAREESFRRINRPAKCVHLTEIIEGLCTFAGEYKGQLWLEILFVRNINDSDEDIEALKEIIQRITPDKIQLNTVIRPPLEEFAAPMHQSKLQEISRRLPGTVEIIADFSTQQRGDARSADKTEIIEMLRRRPCTKEDICQALNLDRVSTTQLLHELKETGLITEMVHRSLSYYQTCQTTCSAAPPRI